MEISRKADQAVVEHHVAWDVSGVNKRGPDGDAGTNGLAGAGQQRQLGPACIRPGALGPDSWEGPRSALFGVSGVLGGPHGVLG